MDRWLRHQAQYHLLVPSQKGGRIIVKLLLDRPLRKKKCNIRHFLSLTRTQAPRPYPSVRRRIRLLLLPPPFFFFWFVFVFFCWWFCAVLMGSLYACLHSLQHFLTCLNNALYYPLVPTHHSYQPTIRTNYQPTTRAVPTHLSYQPTPNCEHGQGCCCQKREREKGKRWG